MGLSWHRLPIPFVFPVCGEVDSALKPCCKPGMAIQACALGWGWARRAQVVQAPAGRLLPLRTSGPISAPSNPSGGKGGKRKAQGQEVPSGANEAAGRPAGNGMACEP